MQWRRWLALLGVLTFGFSLYVFFSGTGPGSAEALDWQAGLDPLPRCSDGAPATFRERGTGSRPLAPARQAVSVAYSLDSTPPGVHCRLRLCRAERPSYSGEYLVNEVNPPCSPALRSANFFARARATDYLYVPAFGGGYALSITLILFGLYLTFRATRWAYRQIWLLG